MLNLKTKDDCRYQFNEFLERGAVAAFSNRKLNLGFRESSLMHIKENRKAFLVPLGIELDSLVCAQQPHGRKAVIVGEKDKGRGAYVFDTAVADCDALITNCPNLALGVFTADCLSVFLYAPSQKVIGIIHAGWRSTRGGIVKNTLELMIDEFGVEPQGLLAGLGPAIRSCCYEVGEEFIEYFPSGVKERHGRLYLDLAGVNIAWLKEMGVNDGHIIDSGICTACHNNDFFSHRREGEPCGRQMSVIML